jgi:hypothetical protein
MCLITACFARALQRWTSRICVHFLLTFQEVMPISTTRNQLNSATRSDILTTRDASHVTHAHRKHTFMSGQRPEGCRSPPDAHMSYIKREDGLDEVPPRRMAVSCYALSEDMSLVWARTPKSP